MTATNDFTTLEPWQIAAFVVAHQAELGCEGIAIEDVTAGLDDGSTVLETRPYGFAVIQNKPTSNGLLMSFLWLLYVDPTRRGKGLGHRFMRSIMRVYSHDYHLSLHCYGARRRKFFGRLGFRIESKDGDLRRMTTSEAR